ncbi:MAG: 5'-methylthioadenosine nucleosidase [Pseudomonadota bacterium]|nr:5'-methylthioadenosine nucleosidase [Pseudomonadota bacterium]
MKKHAALIVALEQELPNEGLADWPVIYTGVGKVNAAIALMAALADVKPDLLINYGTAGAVKSGLAGIVEVGESVQYDMDVRPLGLELGETPFETDTARFTLSDSPFTCGTADRFATSPPDIPCDLVDMELYALAKIAAREQIPLRSFKFISDEADASANEDWKNSLPDAATAFLSLQKTLLAL